MKLRILTIAGMLLFSSLVCRAADAPATPSPIRTQGYVDLAGLPNLMINDDIKFIRRVAALLNLPAVSDGPIIWSLPGTQIVDITPAVKILEQQDKAQDMKDILGDAQEISTGPETIDPKQTILFFYKDSTGPAQSMVGTLTGFDGEIYQFKANGKISKIAKKNVLFYGLVTITPATANLDAETGDDVPESNALLGGMGASHTTGTDVYVHGYTRKNGTYVPSHTRAAPGHGRR